MRLLFALTLLLVASCATDRDVRQEHLIACETYTAVLEQLAVRKRAGLFNERQLTTIRSLEAQATPLCQTAAPTAEGLALLNQAMDALQVYLLTEL